MKEIKNELIDLTIKMTIKNLLTIIVKLIGLIFILISSIYIIPGYVTLIFIEDTIYPEEIIENSDLSMALSFIITDIFINLFIYYLFIYKTELVLKFLHIDQEFTNKTIGNLNLNLQIYVQITLYITAVILCILAIPEVIISTVQHFRIKDDFLTIESFDLIHNIIISVSALLILIFSDQIARFLIK